MSSDPTAASAPASAAGPTIASADAEEVPAPRDPSIEPDTKDWTWVLERPCPECGFDASEVRRDDVAGRMRANADAWVGVLDDPDAAVRPAPHIWSVLEYACHVRDVHRVFGERLRMMLAVDYPLFEDWDQDVAAVAGAYGDQDASVVAQELSSAAERVATTYSGVEGAQWDRQGRRSNGSEFTIETIARYHLHDVEHHLRDVNG